jgi:O-antigen ligase
VIAFLRQYSALLLGLALLYVSGRAFEPLSYAVLLIFSLRQFARKREDVLILLMMSIFILGDSRLWTLFFFKNLRIVMVLILTVKTLLDLFRRKYPLHPLTWVALLFYLLSAAVVARNPEPFLSFQKATSYFLLLFVVLHFLTYQLQLRGEPFFRAVIYHSGWVLSIGLLLIVLNPSLAFFFETGRFRGVFGNPNGVGIYLNVMLPVYLLYYWRYSSRMPMFDKAWVLGVWLLSLLLCLSRTSIASAFLLLLLSLVFRRKSAFRYVLILALIPIFAFLSNLNNIIWLVKELGLAQQLRIDTLASGSGRFFAWQWAMDQFTAYPLLGRGFAYEELLFKNLPDWLILTGHQGEAHNSYISFLLNNGVLGLALILWFYYRFLRRIPARWTLWPLVVSLFFSSFFEPWLHSSLNAFTIHLNICIGLYICHSKPLA